MKKLIAEVRTCDACREILPHSPRPVLAASNLSRIIVIGQAPGRKVHESGIPWDDRSGQTLREWLGVDAVTFYDVSNFAIIPMGFCYPGHGPNGDLPPRPECARKWHPVILPRLRRARLTLLVGSYAQRYYLGNTVAASLTQTVKNFRDYLPHYFPLVHPSPRNGIWLKKNPWFAAEVLPVLRETVASILLNGSAN